MKLISFVGSHWQYHELGLSQPLLLGQSNIKYKENMHLYVYSSSKIMQILCVTSKRQVTGDKPFMSGQCHFTTEE